MSAEWHRRILCIAYAAVFAALSRKLEGHYLRAGLDPVWTTRILAIAILILCFRLSDMIPDSHWPQRGRMARAEHGLYLLLVVIWICVFMGVSGGNAH